MFTNVADEWMEEYITEGYGASDPFAAYAATKTSDFVYTRHTENKLPNLETPTVQEILRGSAEYGMRTSLLSPFHQSFENYIVGFNLGTSLETENFLSFWEQKKIEILLGTAMAQSFTSKLLKDRHHSESWVPFNDDAIKLTPREVETLNWLANGLRVDRISEKMNISTETVNFHIKGIKTKLKAKTREHAVAKAFLENLIR